MLVAGGFPGVRVAADRDAPGATVVATSLDDVRGLVRDPHPGGPIR
jgi:hypothetical protein